MKQTVADRLFSTAGWFIEEDNFVKEEGEYEITMYATCTGETTLRLCKDSQLMLLAIDDTPFQQLLGEVQTLVKKNMVVIDFMPATNTILVVQNKDERVADLFFDIENEMFCLVWKEHPELPEWFDELSEAKESAIREITMSAIRTLQP